MSAADGEKKLGEERERERREGKRKRGEQALSEPHSPYYRGGHAEMQLGRVSAHDQRCMAKSTVAGGGKGGNERGGLWRERRGGDVCVGERREKHAERICTC